MFASMLEQFGRNGADAVDLVEEGRDPGQDQLFMELKALAPGNTKLCPRFALHPAKQLGS